jgi:hypothetical protein
MPSTTVVAALASSTKMIEVLILAVVVILLGTILVLYRRNSRPAKAGDGHGSPTAASYYSDVGTLSAPTGMGGGFGGQSDPFAGFGGSMEQNQYAAPQAPPPPPPPPPPMSPAMPPPGTPAGWMPDPAGAPDTLRYWDGMSWTQHVAKRN